MSMRASICILCISLVFVTQISATYIQSYETTAPKERVKKIPSHIKEYFQLKTFIQGALNKMEDDKETLEDISEKLDRVISCMVDASMGMQIYTLNIVVAVINDSTRHYEHYPTDFLPCNGNKCFIPSNYFPDFPVATYSDASQKCLQIGGKLAEPDLLKGSTFGFDVFRSFSEYLSSGQENYWIHGEGNSDATSQIVSGGGFVIPNDFFRYKAIHNFPSTPPVITPGHALTLAGPLNWGQRHWYIDSKPSNNQLPYICEFKVTYVPFPDQNRPIKFFFIPLDQYQSIVATRKKVIPKYCLKADSFNMSLRGNNNGKVDGHKLSLEELKKKLLPTKFSILNWKDFAASELNINGKSKKQKFWNESFIETFLPDHLWNLTKSYVASTPQESEDKIIVKPKNPAVPSLAKLFTNGTTEVPDKSTGSSISNFSGNLSKREEGKIEESTNHDEIEAPLMKPSENKKDLDVKLLDEVLRDFLKQI